MTYEEKYNFAVKELEAAKIWKSNYNPPITALLALLGIFRTVEMIPILLLEIFYKVLWLILVVYPLWQSNELVGSGIEETAFAFALVVLPILAVPWGYVFKRYILGKKNA
ncbi:DUF6404 family protein [Alishewanella longhuensis]